MGLLFSAAGEGPPSSVDGPLHNIVFGDISPATFYSV
jgi:hypothetical protein